MTTAAKVAKSCLTDRTALCADDGRAKVDLCGQRPGVTGNHHVSLWLNICKWHAVGNHIFFTLTSLIMVTPLSREVLIRASARCDEVHSGTLSARSRSFPDSPLKVSTPLRESQTFSTGSTTLPRQFAIWILMKRLSRGKLT